MAIRDKFSFDRTYGDSENAVSRFIADFLEHPGSHLALMISAVVIVAPVIVGALLTTQTTAQVYNLNYVRPGSLSTMYQNYHEVLFRWNFGRLLLNTFLVAGVATVGALVLSLLAALAIVFYRFRLSRAAFFFILLTLMVPFVIRVVPLYELVVQIGWHDTYWGLTIPFLASATGVFLLRQHFKSIPVEQVEACRLDGIGPITFLWKVLIPQTKGMLAGLSVILFVGTWNAYFWPLIVINTEHRQMIQVGIRNLQSAQEGTLTAYNLMMTGSMISLLPALLILIAFRKYLLTTMGLKL